MTIQSNWLIAIFFFGLLHTYCATAEQDERGSSDQNSSGENAQVASDSVAYTSLSQTSLELEVIQTNPKSSETFAHIKYSNADFAFVIRCHSGWTLRQANGMNARYDDGSLVPMTGLESRAVWESAIASAPNCTSFGERLIRASISDPLAPSGSYFYLFRPCKFPEPKQDSDVQSYLCSSNLMSSPDISLYNEITDQKRKIFIEILTKENQLVGLALKLKSQLSLALEAQRMCEQNTAVDAVREAKSKALRTVLSTSIAAAMGGAIAGPAAALAAARQTLTWITEYLGSGTQANPANCGQMKDSEILVETVATEMEILHKKISQLKNELADFTGE